MSPPSSLSPETMQLSTGYSAFAFASQSALTEAAGTSSPVLVSLVVRSPFLWPSCENATLGKLIAAAIVIRVRTFLSVFIRKNECSLLIRAWPCLPLRLFIAPECGPPSVWVERFLRRTGSLAPGCRGPGDAVAVDRVMRQASSGASQRQGHLPLGVFATKAHSSPFSFTYVTSV